MPPEEKDKKEETQEPVSHETAEETREEQPKDEGTETNDDSEVLAKLEDVISKVDKLIDAVTVLSEQHQDVSHETEETGDKDDPYTLEDYQNLLD